MATGKQIGVLRGHEHVVSSVAFSPDGGTLATGSWDRTARLWELEQGLADLACARVRFLPLSDKDRQRFGIIKEWCTPEVSAELRAELHLDESQNNLGSELEIGIKRLKEAVEAYRATLQERTREAGATGVGDDADAPRRRPCDARRAGERDQAPGGGGQVFHAALQEYTREQVPLQWATTQNNLGAVLMTLGERESGTRRLEEAASSFLNVLQVDPDDERAYRRANFLCHGKMFAFAKAFDLNRDWVERHPDDLIAQANFAEAAFTVGRFTKPSNGWQHLWTPSAVQHLWSARC